MGAYLFTLAMTSCLYSNAQVLIVSTTRRLIHNSLELKNHNTRYNLSFAGSKSVFIAERLKLFVKIFQNLLGMLMLLFSTPVKCVYFPS